MRVIKYLLSMQSRFNLHLPIDTVVLSVQVQRNMPVLYVAVPRDFPDGHAQLPSNERALAVRTISLRCVETGEFFTPSQYERYIGTVMLNGGDHVLHYYQVLL